MAEEAVSNEPVENPVNWVHSNYNNAYVRCMQLTTVINTVAFIIAGYLVIFKSPPTMKLYKWFLLNVMVCSYISDTFQSVFYIPFMLAPMFGGCTLGLLRYFDLFGIKLGILPWEFLSITGVSLLTAITFRYLSLSGSATDYFKKPAVITMMAVVHIFYGSPMLYWSMKLAPRSEKTALAFIQKFFPESVWWYKHHACYAFTIDYEQAWTYGIVALSQLSVAMIIAATIIILTICKLRAQRHVMSARTYEMHKILLRALIIQLFVPIIFIFCSYFTFGFVTLVHVTAQYHPQYLCMAAFAVASLHSTANIVVMIFFTRPYRTALADLYESGFIFGRFTKTSSAMHTLNSLNSESSATRSSGLVEMTKLDAIEERHRIITQLPNASMDL